MRQLIIDIETTGFSTTKGDRIVEFCALEMIDNKLTGNKLHLFFNPEREISEENSKIHGLTMDHLQDKPKFAEKAQEIKEFIESNPPNITTWIIHNAQFDTKFIHAELVRANLMLNAAFIEDTLLMARSKLNLSKNSLTALCEHFGIEDNRDHHGALADCELLAQVYLKLMDMSNAIN